MRSGRRSRPVSGSPAAPCISCATQVDTGPIIAQAVVPVLGDDDEASLSGRILAAEHRLYPLAVRLFAEGRLRVSGNTVAVAGAEAPEGVMLNPSEALVSRAG